MFTFTLARAPSTPLLGEVTEERLVVDESRENVLSSPPLDTDVVPGGEQQYDVNTHYRELPYSPFGA